ncbi:MAG: hypothetical protein RLZZ555_227 [Pseudomonadota bacterium]|jgi:GH24 family phage-related lysozyme (muramidase)
MATTPNTPSAGLQEAALLAPSRDLIELLKQVESLRLKPYDDQTDREISAWVPGATVGYGHLISKAEWPTLKGGISAAHAKVLFERDLAPFVAGVRSRLQRAVLQQEFDAMVMLAFNIGSNAFAGSRVLGLINAGHTADSRELEAAWKSWNRSQHKILQGLVRRRQCEWDIFTKGVYASW